MIYCACYNFYDYSIANAYHVSYNALKTNERTITMEFHQLKCPNCGSTLDMEDGLNIFYCKYCGTKIIVTNENAESIYTLLVTRAPNLDKSLANLNKLEVVEYPKLDFNPNVLDYTLKFNSIPNSLTINARAKSTDGKIDIIGNENLKNKDKVIVKVTLIETGIVREYTLNIVENKGMSSNKNIIVIAIILLVITIIVMSILDIKDKKKKRHEKLKKIKKLKKEKEKVKSKSKPKDVKKEEEIEII